MDVNGKVTINSKDLYVVPSQVVAIDAVANVKTVGNGEITNGIIRAKVNVTTTSKKAATIAVVPNSVVDEETCYWKQHTDGYYYLMQNNNTESSNL